MGVASSPSPTGLNNGQQQPPSSMNQIARGPSGGQASVSSSAAAATLNSYASTFRNINSLNGYGYEAAAAAAAAAAWVGRFDPSATSLGRLDAASASFPAGLAASQAAVFRRSGKSQKLINL